MSLQQINFHRQRWGLPPLGEKADGGYTPANGGCSGCGSPAPQPSPPAMLASNVPAVRAMAADVIMRCEVIVKSFRRFDSLLTFCRSVQSHYPGLKIHVADDSLRDGESYPDAILDLQREPNIHWHQMPFDSGLSAGRNLLVQRATKDILILCDDDFVFRTDTRLEHFLTVLDAEPSLSLVAGLVQNAGKPVTNWAATYMLKQSANGSRTLSAKPVTTPWQSVGAIRYRRADVAWNFFAARRESLLRVPWDDQFRISGEHIDFFLSRMEAGEASAYTPHVSILHAPAQPGDYSSYRARTKQHYDMLKQKWNLKRIQSLAPYKESAGEPPLPPVTRQLKNVATAAVRHIASGMAEVDATERNIRRAVCESCSYFRHLDRRCSHEACGCFIDTKLRMASEQCPIGRWPVDVKPNIIVMGVGHSGTTILTRLLTAFGWHAGKDVDEEYFEDRRIRALNEDSCLTEQLAANAAYVLSAIPQPWALKDPRFCETLSLWLPHLEPYRPLLLWIVRDPAAVEASYERRGEPDVMRGMTRDDNIAHAAAVWNAWPWAKLRVSHEQIVAAAAMVDIRR